MLNEKEERKNEEHEEQQWKGKIFFFSQGIGVEDQMKASVVVVEVDV